MSSQQPQHQVGNRQGRRKARFYWPREHGGWSMLGSACVVGGAAGQWGAGALAAILVALGLFMVREPLYVSLNRRNAWLQVGATCALMSIPGIYLLINHSLWWVLGAALFAGISTFWHMRMRLHRQERSIGSEVLGIAQLTSAAPLVQVFGSGFVTEQTYVLWLLLFVYYTGSIFYVKMRVSQARQKPQGWRELFALGRANGVYQAMVVLMLMILAITGLLPWWVVVGFAPNIIKSVIHIFAPLRNLSLKRIGVTEMLYAAMVTVALTIWARG